jgi:hypothetical protein
VVLGDRHALNANCRDTTLPLGPNMFTDSDRWSAPTS